MATELRKRRTAAEAGLAEAVEPPTIDNGSRRETLTDDVPSLVRLIDDTLTHTCRSITKARQEALLRPLIRPSNGTVP